MHPRIEKLIQIIAKFPGLGPKSSRRLVIYLLRNQAKVITPFIHALNEIEQYITKCDICFNLDCSNPCSICDNPLRDKETICIVENLVDLWAFERSKIYKGLYHVLGGALSAMEGVYPEHLNIPALLERVKIIHPKEIILATNTTIEGQTTAHYIANVLKENKIENISFLAHGIPIGGEIDYLDDGTLEVALQFRKKI